MPMKWTGRDIANLMRKSHYRWNSGALAAGETNCAVGMLVKSLGVPQDHIDNIAIPHDIKDIFGVNDNQSTKLRAARAIEKKYSNRVFPVAQLEENIKSYAEEAGIKLKPNCNLLDKVKAAHKD